MAQSGEPNWCVIDYRPGLGAPRFVRASGEDWEQAGEQMHRRGIGAYCRSIGLHLHHALMQRSTEEEHYAYVVEARPGSFGDKWPVFS